MRFAPVRAAAAIALAGSIGAGCGGGGDGSRDAAQVRLAWRTYASALASKDGAAVCKAITPRLARSLETIVRSHARTPAFAQANCPQIMSVALGRGKDTGSESVLEPLLDGTVRDVRISDGTARFNVHGAVHGQGVNIPGEAKKVAGTWRISCCVGPGIAG